MKGAGGDGGSPAQSRGNGLDTLGSPGQPSLGVRCQTAPVLQTVHREEAESTARLPYLSESLRCINKDITRRWDD